MKKNIFLIGLLILILGFSLGIVFTLSYNFGKNLGCQLTEKEIMKTEKQTEKGLPISPVSPELREGVFSYFGEITKIEDQRIILKARIPQAAPFEEERFETKKVKITETTEIVKLVEKKPEEMKKTPSPGVIEEPFKEEKISLSDLKPGDEIIVQSEEEDIEGKEEFVASKIVKLPLMPVIPE